MLGHGRLLTFCFRALVLLLLIAMLWIGLAEPYNGALVAVARPAAPDGLAMRALGTDIMLEHALFAQPVSVRGLTLHFGLVLMVVLVMAAVDVPPLPRASWLVTFVAGLFVAHAVAVMLLPYGYVWAAKGDSPAWAGTLVSSLYAVYWGLLPALAAGAWCLWYWLPRVRRSATGTAARASGATHTAA
jgi:hypothetical protein